jgi:hypothetical protein
MLIYILEDREYRMKFFRDNFLEDEIIHSGCAEEFLDLITCETRTIDLMFLDHDLNEGEYKGKGSGIDVSNFLVSASYMGIINIIIHSTSSKGLDMTRDLIIRGYKRTLWLPFDMYMKEYHQALPGIIQNVFKRIREGK